MFKIIKLCIRTSENIPFYFELEKTPEALSFSKYYDGKYIKEGKALHSSREISADKLSVSITALWRDKNSFREFLCDNECYKFLQLNKIYDFQNNIDSKIIFMGDTDE